MFQPVVPLSGLAGWNFLQRTYDAQFETFSSSIAIQRDTDYFAEKIGEISSAEELVSDRRLLSVALGAFGLQDDINNRYFIQKVLEEGTTNDDSLANRLANPQYSEMSASFGFGPSESLLISSDGFAEDLIQRFQENSFEVAAGTQNNAMRVALYAQRELPDLAGGEGSNDAKWFTVLGDPPMRQLFEKALNLPSSIGQIDIDQQLEVFKDRAASVFGSDDLSLFVDDEIIQDTITKFVIRDQVDSFSGGLSGGSIALTLLQSRG